MTPAVSLAYVAAMQEHGIPVTYAYLTTAHESPSTGNPFGPGEAGYVQNLQAFDAGFAAFFNRLQSDGITPSNTLFVITADEGDHFVGGTPSPATCDGVTVPCTYNRIGELDVNVTGLLATKQNITTPFGIHEDMAPAYYLDGQPANNAPTTRAFDRGLANLTIANPLTGKTDTLVQYLADAPEQSLLHLITADPARTPTIQMFAQHDYWVMAGSTTCTGPCAAENPFEAWNHGGISPDVNVTWLGLVGPSVQHLGVTSSIWSDHTDIRSTMLSILGLSDDYSHEGRSLVEVLDANALPPSIQSHEATFVQLAQIYKQINAPVGPLGLGTLSISTRALASGSSTDDSLYTSLEGQLTSIGRQRDSLATKMSAVLEGAEFNNQPFDVQQAQNLIAEGQALLDQVNHLASN
jgi:hypothetical protein